MAELDSRSLASLSHRVQRGFGWVVRIGLLSSAMLVGEAGAQPDPDYLLSLRDVTGLPGESVDVGVLLDFPNGEDVAGFSLGVCATPDDGSVVDVSCRSGAPNECFENGVIVPGAALADTNNGVGPDFFAPATHTVPVRGWTTGAVVSLVGGDSLPTQDNAEIVVARYDLLGPVGTTSELTFCEIGIPTVLITIGVVVGGGVEPLTRGGSIAIEDTPLTFIRGDANADGCFNGLPDGIFLLNLMFVPGSAVPPCPESADVDGNGVLDGLSDGIFALRCQFDPRSPCPPDPFPLCGVDPEPQRSLGCSDASGCP